MLIRREDFGNIEELLKGSHKKIWFTCDVCGMGILQAYRTYLNQKDGKFCRICRNINSANKKYVKEKHSKNSKAKWKDPVYREMMSKKLSKACKDAWDKDDGTRKKWLYENNPMYKKEVKEKQSINSSTDENELKEIASKNGFEYLGCERFQKGGTILIVKCKKQGHISKKKLHVFYSFINNVDKCYQM